LTKLILEGGTDVAEMALFCSDSISNKQPDNEIISKLEKDNALIRLSTGADGGYLLHLYVDDEIEDTAFDYCCKDDLIKGRFKTQEGNISFGGLESVTSSFEPNKNIRSDGCINKGVYDYFAYRTEYPDDLIEDEVINIIGKEGYRYLNKVGIVIWLNVIVFIFLITLTFSKSIFFALPAILVAVWAKTWLKKYTTSSKYLMLENQKLEIERKYPSIIIKLESIQL
jgi:hypothetical protein